MEFYLTNGVLGATTLLLVVVVVILYRRTEQLYAEKTLLHDLRLEDAKKYGETAATNLQKWHEFEQKFWDELSKRKARYGS